MKAWMRILKVELTSKKLNKTITFGDDGDTNLNISVKGSKHMSALKDTCTIRISNLTFSDILQLIDGEFYEVNVIAGYRSLGAMIIFSGSVVYISNELGDRKSNDVIIYCGNKFLGQVGQSQMNLGLNSGINIYSALSFIAQRSGLQNFQLDEKLKNRLTYNELSVKGSGASFFETFTENNGLTIMSDSSYGSNLSIFTVDSNKMRVLNLVNNDAIILTSGYPTLNSEGLHLQLMPTYNFMPLDIIKIDNSIIDIGNEGQSGSDRIIGRLLNRDGLYVIYQIDYVLENRGSNFNLSVLAKGKHLFNSLVGENNG